ncbi:hypothetical protein JG688_00001160 [Phytophthora aleatoria]|uniref:Transmembrane protein n=1 Tax=Phytophthora aleatoria TaxID=2496075 RepID=A0A8J5JBR2_9STRA|nr:hypothetical protein JG688_00001160 [Phytophthora aleatoria]
MGGGRKRPSGAPAPAAPLQSQQSLRAQAEAKYEVQLAEHRQLEQERMSSYTDDAFECESPHAILAILASSRGVRPEQRSDLQTTSPYLAVDNIGRLRVDSVSDSDAHDEVAYGELAQPRPEIILRWKRFAVLVVLTATVMSAIAAWLREGFVVDNGVPLGDADTRVDTVNSYIGLIMGFIESIVGLGVEEIFPVFIVYLHNLRWYPGDDPATKKQGKFKKFALTIFIPAVMMAEWGVEFGNGWSREEATKRVEISSHSGAESAASDAQLSEVMPLATAYELWVQGKPILLKSVRATSSSQASTPPASTDEFLDDVVSSLLDMGLPLMDVATVNASFETRTLSSLMDLHVITLKLPLQSPSNASVVCGETSCALLEPQLNLKHHLPRKQVGMAQMNTSNAAFLYGFTTATNVERDATIATRSLELSFGYLSWRFDRAAYVCDPGTSSEEGCQVLHHQLGDSDRHLALPKQWLPSQLQRGSLESPVSLVQLLEPKIRLHPGQTSSFATLEHLESWPQDSTLACSTTMDTYLRYVDDNHFYLSGDMVETMAASALLFIFQNARVLDSAPGVEIMMTQRRLVDTSTRRVKVFLTNTKVGNVCTWTGCGVLLLLTVLVLVLPNERARLAPPRGGNARAERFVAVQTEQIYPNLIYKKRFLIGKTGEEIKFGEFAVESAGLHHKMEEDEQIYI